MRVRSTVKTFWRWLIEKYGIKEAARRYSKWKKAQQTENNQSRDLQQLRAQLQEDVETPFKRDIAGSCCNARDAIHPDTAPWPDLGSLGEGR